ncbi:hypothetical protein AB0H42_26635 [Nocardia sp. NPDC050799]|uniref:hypothetical protein n=1 Tax=Nocardia sp. NPDC050799 TaxID=3154842 RepID=UPI0033CCB06C
MNLAHRAAVIALALIVPTAVSAPAGAHAGGLSPAAVRSEELTVSPVVRGLTVTTIEDGARLLISNNTGLLVEISPGGGATAPASVPSGESRAWIDSRATILDRELGSRTSAPWSVPITAGPVPVTVTGRFVAAPPPAAPVWWIATAGLAAAVLVPARRVRRPELMLAIAGLVTVLASLAHVIGSTLAVQSASPVGTFLDAMGIGLLVWPMVTIAAVAAWRGRAAGVLGVCVGAALNVVFILPDITVFHFGVLPFAGPDAVERLLVALVLGAGTGVAVGGAGALRVLAGLQHNCPNQTGK